MVVVARSRGSDARKLTASTRPTFPRSPSGLRLVAPIAHGIASASTRGCEAAAYHLSVARVCTRALHGGSCKAVGGSRAGVRLRAPTHLLHLARMYVMRPLWNALPRGGGGGYLFTYSTRHTRARSGGRGDAAETGSYHGSAHAHVLQRDCREREGGDSCCCGGGHVAMRIRATAAAAAAAAAACGFF